MDCICKTQKYTKLCLITHIFNEKNTFKVSKIENSYFSLFLKNGKNIT